MQTGSNVYSDITRRVAAATDTARRAGERLDALRAADEQARRAVAEATAALARERLSELEGDRVRARLDAADELALQLLEERRRRRAQLADELRAGDERLAELEQQREERLAARDERGAAHRARVDATMQRLAQDEDYAAQRSHTAALVDRAGHAGDKAQQAEEDRERKGAPYEQDKLFSYLWRRRFRYPEYRAWPLLRALDGWVAGLCGYERAHRDYAMLLEIPVRLRAHAARAADEAAAAANQLAELEQAALAADGAPALAAALARADEAVDEADRAIAAAERAHATHEQELADIDAGADERTRRSLAAVHAQLALEDIGTLRQDAAATSTPRDDVLVRELAARRDEQHAAAAAVDEAQRAHDEAQRALRELRDLARRFREHRFDASDSQFGGGFDLGALLGGILHGTMTSGSVWGDVRRHQRWRRSGPSGAAIAGRIIGGILSSGRSRGGGFGGGFRSGGGFGGGGGGFRSGGGFGGGGGGFRTGGGF